MKWDVPEELSESERKFVARLRRGGKFYVFLREVRHRLFDEEFQAELEMAYEKPRGTEPLPPALLATVLLLQAYERSSDFDAVENAAADLRWQLVLGCLGAEEAPFSQGDSSPLLGAGRVEDTWNLLGRALSTVVDCAAKVLDVPREQVLREAKLTLLSGPSLKAALDIDWEDEEQKAAALRRLLVEADSLQAWVRERARGKAKEPLLQQALAGLRRVLAQDLEPDPSGAGGGLVIRRGVAKDRMPSLGDKQMRHGRKSKARVFNGYKRHIAMLPGQGLLLAAIALPANRPDHEAVGALLDEAGQHGAPEAALIDRGYLASPRLEALRSAGTDVRCKPWPSRNQGRYTKEDFVIDLKRGELTCPAGAKARISQKSRLAHFEAATCDDVCVLRTSCTAARRGHGRTVSIHSQEELLLELRQRRRTAEGRAALRERVYVEHALAKLGAVQGPRARYKGTRRNELDVRRCAAVVNLQAIARAMKPPLRAAA